MDTDISVCRGDVEYGRIANMLLEEKAQDGAESGCHRLPAFMRHDGSQLACKVPFIVNRACRGNNSSLDTKKGENGD